MAQHQFLEASSDRGHRMAIAIFGSSVDKIALIKACS